MPTRRALLGTLAALGTAGCSLGADAGDRSPVGDRSPTDPGAAATPPRRSEYWYTHTQATGNRTLAGSGGFRDADPVTFDPAGQPQWLVAHPVEGGSHWTVVAADGRASGWLVRDGAASRVREYDPLTAGSPPVVATGDGPPRLVRPPESAPHTSPMVVTDTGDDPAKLLSVASNGDLVVTGTERTRLAVDALPDGRLAAVGDGRYALFGTPADRYAHGALGDTTEPAALVVVDPAAPAVDWRETVGPPAVFEGLQPLVADLDGDGDPEVVTTVADSSNGARIAVFSATGERLATGPVYGPGWRHQLAVAPFGSDGRPELAVVRKPHVDRVLEFYRFREGALSVVATVEGLSSHTYGSRILDGAVAGDFDGDGRVEVLVPTADRTALAAVRRTTGGASVAWRLPVGGPVGSNLTGVALADGVAVGAASGGAVRVWQG